MGERHHVEGITGVVAESMEGHRERDRVGDPGATGPARRPAARRHVVKLELDVALPSLHRQSEGRLETEIGGGGTARRRTPGKEHLQLHRGRRLAVEEVEAQIEVAVVMAEPDPAHRTAGWMHGAEERRHVDIAARGAVRDRKSTRLNSSHANISYAVFCLKKKKKTSKTIPPYNNRQADKTSDTRSNVGRT